jgi:hypothetical protein
MSPRRAPRPITIAAALIALLLLPGGWLTSAQAGSLIFPSPDLPPVGGKYVHLGPIVFDLPPGPVVIDHIIHCCFTDVVRVPAGPDEIETFNSTLFARLVTPGPADLVLTGPVQVRVQGLAADPDGLGTFDTELLSMTLTGNSPFGPIQIRESPTMPSLGRTTIEEIGPGQFRIDSFFDVFVELELPPFPPTPQRDGPSRVTLVPAPAALLLLALGGVPVMLRRARRRCR